MEQEGSEPAAPSLIKGAMNMSSRVISKAQVCAKTGLSRATIDRMVARGDFPRPMQLSPRRVGWLEKVIDDWLAAKFAA